MAYIPAYDTTWLATALIKDVSREGTYLFIWDRVVWGPIFPVFVKADFSTLGGFLDFIGFVGINGLTYLDDAKWREIVEMDLERKKLARLLDIAKPNIANEKRLQASYIESFYKRTQKRLIKEQNDMRFFCSFWLRKQFPMERLKTDMIEEAIDRSVDTMNQHLSGVRLEIKYVYSPANKGDERYRIAYSKREGYSLRDYFSDIFKSGNRNHERPQRKKPYWYFHYETLPARCYMEMLDILQDDKEVKSCAYCGEIFIPNRKNEEFCKRLAPGYRGSKESRTCKQIGPQRRFQKDKSQEELERIRKRKQFQNRLIYLKKKGKRKEYLIVTTEFDRWQKETNHRNPEKE